jgi:hypothetical protein
MFGKGDIYLAGIGLGNGGVWGGKDLGKRVSRFWEVGPFGGGGGRRRGRFWGRK